ncbi:hypothetical protein CRYUN_Cryun11dG0128100 [Craigia yunnanensis]
MHSVLLYDSVKLVVYAFPSFPFMVGLALSLLLWTFAFLSFMALVFCLQRCVLSNSGLQANAQEKFMRIKHAYNTLLNSESRRRYNSGNRTSDFSYSGTQRSQSTNVQDEEFYGFGNFLRDVQITLGRFRTSLETFKKNFGIGKQVSSQEKPKSLWEELAAIGEEFVEFLEKELNIADEEVEANNRNDFSNSENTGSSFQNEASKGSIIEENIDEIEATLAKLKKELGL